MLSLFLDSIREINWLTVGSIAPKHSETRKRTLWKLGKSFKTLIPNVECFTLAITLQTWLAFIFHSTELNQGSQSVGSTTQV